mmetsp:Transcript_4521/g.13071  ORF Transcript_4521/g.13071 Transcript_4521/m.13071 type:complete len:751 (-) Transcript_4521:124-2376(-)
MGCGTSTPIANPGSPADSEPGNLHEKCFSSADCRAQDLEAARDTKNVAPSQSIASLLPPSSLQKQGANAEDSDFFSNELSLEDNMHDLPFDGATHHGAPRPFNEAARMSALKSLCVLDTPPDKRFDSITSLCTMIFKVPICLVSLVDHDRQWFKSKQGLTACQTDRDSSFCAWGLLPKHPKVLVVPDAMDDIRFRHNKLVLGPPNIRFYAGTPLILSDGFRIGSLCLIDREPHPDFDAQACTMLANFGEMVVRDLEKDRLLQQQAADEAAEQESETLADEQQQRLQQQVNQASKSQFPPIGKPSSSYDEAIIMCDTAQEGWPIMYASEGWNMRTDIDVQPSGQQPKLFWGTFVVPGSDEKGSKVESTYSSAIEQGHTFNLTVSRADDPNTALKLQFTNASKKLIDKKMCTGIPSMLKEASKEDERKYYYVKLVDMKRPPSLELVSGSNSLSGEHCIVLNEKLDPFEDVQLGVMLGRGAFGRVYRGLWNAIPVAVKVLEHEADKSGREVLEAVLSTDLSHPNVVKTYKHFTREMVQSVTEDLGVKQLLETWIIMEFCSLGTLSDAVDRGWFRQKHSLFEVDFKRILTAAKEIAAAMAYLHSQNILHGDLTGGNILFVPAPDIGGDEQMKAKIADFGFSRVLEGQNVKTVSYGTITHTPPELLVDGVLSKACDVYAFGMIVWEMYMGQRPFTGLNQAQVIHHKMSGRTLSISNNCPEELRALILSCINNKHELRPSFAELLSTMNELQDDLA